MGSRLRALWRLYWRTGAIPGILLGVLAAPIVTFAIGRGSDPPAPLSKGTPTSPPRETAELSPQARCAIDRAGSELTPLAVLTAGLVSYDADRLAQGVPDEEFLTAATDRIAEFSEAWRRAFDEAVREISKREGIRRARARSLLADRLRSLAGRSVTPGPLPFRVCPSGVRFFAAPRPTLAPKFSPERALERAIEKLLGVLAKLPPKSKGAKGVRRAILAIRKAILPFNSKPPQIVFDAPAVEGALLGVVPTIAFRVSDSGSGPDPEARSLLVSGGGVTVDLASLVVLTKHDPVVGTATFEASTIPDETFRDGFLTLSAGARDLAGNEAQSLRSVVLDRSGPDISFLLPRPGTSQTEPEIAIDLVWEDAPAGVDPATLRLTWNGADITDLLSFTQGSTGPFGLPQEVTAKGAVQGTSGLNLFVATGRDKLGNESRVSAAVAIFDAVTPLTRKSYVLQIGERGLPSAEFFGFPGRLSPPVRVKVFGQSGFAQGVKIAPVVVPRESGDLEEIPEIVSSALITNSEGEAAFRVRFPRRIGREVLVRVRVELMDGDTENPVDLTFTTVAPAMNLLIENPEASPFTLHRGGAVGVRIFNAPPLANVRVREVVPEGSMPRGRFLPKDAVSTDEVGEGFAAYFVPPDASPGPVTIRATLTEFTDNDGLLFSVDASFEISADDSAPAVRVLEGQGQRLPLETDSRLIRVFVKSDENPDTVDFALLSLDSGIEVAPENGFAVFSLNGGVAIAASGGEVRFRLRTKDFATRLVTATPGYGEVANGGVANLIGGGPGMSVAVSGPEARLARRKFARDGMRFQRGEDGQGIPLGGFEEIPARDRSELLAEGEYGRGDGPSSAPMSSRPAARSRSRRRSTNSLWKR